MHAILVYGGNKAKREEKIKSFMPKDFSDNHPDVKIITAEPGKKKIGIDQIREIEKFLIKKPIKEKTNLVVIRSANLLTTQAQNALLKTLEEPPKNSVIILETQSDRQLLETVISRCRKIKITQSSLLDSSLIEQNSQVKEFADLIKLSLGKRLDWAENKKSKLANREYTANMLEVWESVLRDSIILSYQNTSTKKTYIINKQNKPLIKDLNLNPYYSALQLERIEKIRSDIQNTNVNTRLAVDTILLGL